MKTRPQELRVKVIERTPHRLVFEVEDLRHGTVTRWKVPCIDGKAWGKLVYDRPSYVRRHRRAILRALRRSQKPKAL